MPWSGLTSVGAVLVMLMSGGCITTKIGNTNQTCREGQACECEGIGNCFVDCPGGGCDVRCEGTGNCYLTCGGGDCNLRCEGTGNCILEECSEGCETECIGFGNCICREGCGTETTSDPGDAG